MKIERLWAEVSATVVAVRLVVWNSCERFNVNFGHLCDLEFDLAVVSECGPFSPSLTDPRVVSSVLKLAVNLPGHTKHIGVLARDPWHVESLPQIADQSWVLPARVRGPVDLTVLAIWALGREYLPDRPSYATQTGRVVEFLLPQIVGPVVIAGDLNAPIASSPAEVRRHDANAAALDEMGLVSAFAATRGNADPLTEPTFFHQWKQNRPFHIDHAFVPKAWAEGMQMEIGTYEDWVATGRSDHVPLVVDLPAASAAE